LIATRLGVDYVYTQIYCNTGADFREADVRIPTAVLAARDAIVPQLVTTNSVVDQRDYFEEAHSQVYEPIACDSDPFSVAEIMQRCYPTSAPIDDNFSGAVFTDFLPTRNKMLYQPKETYGHAFEQRSSTYYRAAAPSYGFKATSTLSNIVDTLIKRFGQSSGNKFRIGKDLEPEPERDVGRQLLQGLIGHFESITPITFEDVANASAEQALRVKIKGDVANTVEFEPELYESIKISSFNKAQTKAKAAENSYLPIANGNLKAGQPISAQPKFMTHLGGAIATALEKCIRRDMPEWMVMGYGLSKLELRAIVRNLRYPAFHQAIECDITEMDSVRGAATNKYFMQKLYDMYGCNEVVTRYAQLLNENWTADAEQFRMAVKGYFHSGRFDTLFSNTLVNLAIATIAFEVKQPLLMIAMGDDLAIIARKITVPKPFNFLKIKKVHIPEWTSELIADDVYPSLPKKVAKLINRCFITPDDLEVYRVAVKDWLHNCNSHSLMRRIIAVNSFKYDISLVDCERLYSFLHGFAYGKVMGDLRSTHFLKHTVPELVVDKQQWSVRHSE